MNAEEFEVVNLSNGGSIVQTDSILDIIPVKSGRAIQVFLVVLVDQTVCGTQSMVILVVQARAACMSLYN